MRTIEITRMEDVQVGDVVALEDRRDSTHDDSITPDPAWRLTGRVREIRSTHSRADGTPYAWQVRIGHTPYPVGTAEWTYTLVSATREVPEWETGMAGTATVGPKRRQARAYSVGKGALVEAVGGGYAVWNADDVHSFEPDDASRWAAQAKLVEIDLDNAQAEVERWKAEAEMLTAKVDRLMPLQEHENECAYRQRAEKAEAEVERLTTVVGRLSCARTLPTIREIEDAISQGFELDCNLTFEGGVPQSVVGRVRDAILIARGRAND